MKIFVEEKWLTGDTCVFTISDMFDRVAVKNGLSKMRRAFIERLKDEGYTITTDRKGIDDETICLIMNCESLIENPESFEEVKEAFYKKIADEAGENFHFPYTVNMEDYFLDPFFPAVFKNELENGGKDKFLVSSPEQLAIIKDFYDKNRNDKEIMEQFANCVMQQFVETPTRYASYMRVLANGAGEIMGANLKCSLRDTNQSDYVPFFENVFLNPKSAYYLKT